MPSPTQSSSSSSSSSSSDTDRKNLLIAAGTALAAVVGYTAYKIIRNYLKEQQQKQALAARKPGGRKQQQPAAATPTAPSSSSSSTTASTTAATAAQIQRPITPTSPSQFRNVFNVVEEAQSDRFDVEKWQLFVQEALGVSFRYPTDFSEPETHSSPMPGGGYMILTGPRNQPAVFMIGIDQLPNGFSLDDLVNQQIMMLQMMGQGSIRVVENASQEVNGMEGRKLVLEVRPPNQSRSQRMEMIIFQRQNRFFTVRLTSEDDAEHQRIQRLILDTVRASDVSTVGTLVFHGMKHNLDFELPSVDFKVREDESVADDSVVLDAVYEDPNDGSTISGVKITSKPQRDNTSDMDKFIENVILKHVSDKNGFKEHEPITVCGTPARVFEYSDVVNGSTNSVIDIAFIHGGHTFLVRLYSKPSEFASFSARTLKSVASMNIDATGVKRDADRVTYTNPRLKFSIEVEKEVALTEHLMTDPALTINYTNRSEKEESNEMFQTVVLVEDNPFGNDLNTIKNTYKQDLQKNYRAVKKDEIVKLNGRDAMCLHFIESDQFNQPILNVLHSVPVNSKLYTVKSTTYMAFHDKEVDAKINRAHQSFRILQ